MREFHFQYLHLTGVHANQWKHVCVLRGIFTLHLNVCSLINPVTQPVLGLDYFPDELITHILSFLLPSGLQQLCQANSRFYGLTADENIHS